MLYIYKRIRGIVMKITQEHYNHIKQAITPLASKLILHREALKSDTRVKDLEKRLRWDGLYAAHLSQWLCDNVYSYMDDTHIDTALKSIMKELSI